MKFSFRWSIIAGRLPGRTDNEIKNYWNTHIRRKLMSRGIDPTTHRPLHQTLSDITISFVKQEERINEEKEKVLRCPDLNLELCISPPFQEMNTSLHVEPVMKREEGDQGFALCFTCSLGLHKTQGCKCNNSSSSVVLGL